VRSEAELWWRQTQADLKSARDNMVSGNWYLVSWLAHQAVEKALKTVHIERSGSVPPATHSLVHLGIMLAVPPEIASDLGYLNPAFDLARYPDLRGKSVPVDEITEDIAERDLAAAQRVLAWCRNALNL
jgi:HEPN domain-containing protein